VESPETTGYAVDVVERLWRAYTPFQLGRDTSGDLTSMLAILLLALFVESAGRSDDEFVRRWERAVAEARIGVPPLTDLRAALRSAGGDKRFPLPGILDIGAFGDGSALDDVPWAGAFLAALQQRPTLAEAGSREVCELLLERHVQESTFSAGEFYTPHAVGRLLTDVASPQVGDRILDPACGSGSLLAAAARRIAQSGRADAASFEAYATDRSNLRLAMMNLALHGVSQPVVLPSDPVALIQGRDSGLADVVMSNPPFNQRMQDSHDVAWPFGGPPKSNANFAWLQLAWARLSEHGIATVIMPPGAAWSINDREAAIRREMIARGALLGVIALPPNLFVNTSVPVDVWVLARDKSRHLPTGDADAVLFIDARRLGTQVPRRPRVLTSDDVERISNSFHVWRRSPRTTLSEPGFSRSVRHEEILENDGKLDPRLYVDLDQDRSNSPLDTSSMLTELDLTSEATSRSSDELRKLFSVCERLIHNDVESVRVPLRSIVSGSKPHRFGDSAPDLLLAGPSGSLIRAEHYVDKPGVPVVMPRDLTNSGFSVASIRYISAYQAEGLDRFRLHCGDVVLARRGELGRCAVVREEQHGWICGTGCFILRATAELDADYFAAYLRSLETRTWLDAHATGSATMKTISLNALSELPVALPDLATQRAIGDLVKQLDEHEQLLQQQLELAQKVRRGALNNLLASHRSGADANLLLEEQPGFVKP
jgi:type I restriction enzyme M protein